MSQVDPKAPEQIPARLLDPQSDVDRDDRARMLYRLRAYSRMTYPRLSEMFGISERTCARIVTEYRETRAAMDVDEEAGRTVLAESLESFEDDLEKASVMYQMAVGQNNVSAAIGAIALRGRLTREKLNLCQEVGILPRDLGTFRHVVDMEEAGRRILEVFRRYEVPEPVQQAVVLALEGGDPAEPDTVDGTIAE